MGKEIKRIISRFDKIEIREKLRGRLRIIRSSATHHAEQRTWSV